jgi:predicted amidohydrolase YtcJ
MWRWADLMVMDIDPLSVGATDPGNLLNDNIRLTMVGGKIVHSIE